MCVGGRGGNLIKTELECEGILLNLPFAEEQVRCVAMTLANPAGCDGEDLESSLGALNSAFEGDSPEEQAEERQK